MQCRTELGAVEGKDPFLVCNELEGRGFTGLKAAMDVIVIDGKTMHLVLGPFDIGDVPGDFITHLDLDHFRTVMTADRRGVMVT